MAAFSGAGGQGQSAETLSDLRKSLTEADKETILATWAKTFSNAEENGRLIFIRFFTDNPKSKSYFKTVPTEGDLLRNRELSFHARRFMVALDNMITNMSNWPRLCTHIGHLVNGHRDKHRVPVEMFQLLLQTALNVFQDHLREDFTSDSLTSWQKFFGALLEEIKAAYVSQHKS